MSTLKSPFQQSNDDRQMTKFFVVAYTPHTHQLLIERLTSRDMQFQQRVTRNEQSYSEFAIRSTVGEYNALKELQNANNDLAFNIEYGSR